MTFMLQKSGGPHGCERGGSGERGRLSVMLQYRYRMEKCFDVPPGAFRPIPAVDSSIVRLAARHRKAATERSLVSPKSSTPRSHNAAR